MCLWTFFFFFFFPGCQPFLKKQVELQHNCVNTNNSCLLAAPLKVFYHHWIKRFKTFYTNETQKKREISVMNCPGQLLIVSATYENCHVEDRYDGYKPEHLFLLLSIHLQLNGHIHCLILFWLWLTAQHLIGCVLWHDSTAVLITYWLKTSC